MNVTHLLPPLALALTLSACGGEAASDGADGQDQLVVGDGSSTPAHAMYQMPTPNELFSLVRSMAGEGQKRMMNPATNADRYVSLTKRAANFGVYSTDLIYASYFRLNVEVVRYYLTVKKLGDQLGLTGAFNEHDFVRLEKNLAYGDSLEVISNEAYFKAYDRLQQDDMGATLALVLAGGWVESMHLVIQQVRGFDPADPLVQRIAEQKFTLEHLVEMMEPHADDVHVAGLRDELITLRDLYDQLTVEQVASPGKVRSGRMVLGQETRVLMTIDQYAAIAARVEELRESIIRPEDQVGLTR
ncbi:MAG: hypothetical protein JNM31_01680 [Flavobacteriales bacterium]|nr:hypothetical protein [Flavobacteriales bacterium]